MRSIDDDPELFHGLSIWGKDMAAQVQTYAGSQYLAVVFREHAVTCTDGIKLMPMDDARRLRDLLNVAAARGVL